MDLPHPLLVTPESKTIVSSGPGRGIFVDPYDFTTSLSVPYFGVTSPLYPNTIRMRGLREDTPEFF